jgi:PAS domain S-box-containing protein
MKALWLEGGKKFAAKTQQELGAKGITVTPVEEIGACLEALKADPESAVVVDLDLLRKGLDAVQEICQNAPDIPVIVLGSLERLPVLEEAFKRGAWDSVIKQLDLSHLYQIPRALARCKENKRLSEEAKKFQAEAERRREEAEQLQSEMEQYRSSAGKVEADARRYQAEAERHREEAERLQSEMEQYRSSAGKVEADARRYQAEIERIRAEVERYREMAESSQGEAGAQVDESGWLGMILQACPEGIFAADEESRLLFTNAALRDILGYGEEELIGKGLNTFVPSLATNDSSWTHVPLPFPQRRWQGKLEYKKKDGSSLPMTTRIIQPLDGKGATKSTVAVCMTRVEADAKEALAMPDAAGVSEDVLSDIIDDFQTPLAVMLGYLQIASMISPDQVEPNQILSIKRTELVTRRLVELVMSHVGAREVEAKRLEIHKSPLDIDQILQPAIEAKRGEASIKNIDIVVDVANDLPPIPIDGVQIERAIGLLLSNAINLSPLGGNVTVSAKLHGNELALVFMDTGSGFSPEEIGTLFNKRTKLRRPSGDVNTVGLYLAHEIVVSHGGRIDVQSDPMEGTTLTVLLPR